MKYIKIFLFLVFLAPFASHAADNEFMVASQLLAAAKNADIQQVQALINNGANVNYVDSTGVSIVCTALMNDDVRAAQILQMYGADASQCDRQIKQYRSKQKTVGNGGLFSGLSSAHGLTLAAAGAAVVVGGLFLLTDVFDPDNGNDNASSGGNRPGGDGGDGGTTSEAAFTTQYGPAMPNASTESAQYASRLDYFSPSTDGILKDNFTLMTDVYNQNYLLMMHGYSPLARGYLGQRTLRFADYSPVPTTTLQQYGIGDLTVGGGMPTNVALVTNNGINAATKPANVASASVNSLDDKLLLWARMNGETISPVQNTNISSKYYNNKIVLGVGEGNQISGATTVEDATNLNGSSFLSNFDLAGYGTVVGNIFATAEDDLLAKIVGGSDSGYATADFFGFMPNGQMTIYRTGGGVGLGALGDGDVADTGTYTTNSDTGALATLKIGGVDLTVIRTGNTIVAKNADESVVYNGYIGADGLLYLDKNSDGAADIAYEMSDNNLTQTKKVVDIDYLNYKALLNAAALNAVGDNLNNGRSRPDVIANSSVVAPLRLNTAATIDDVLAVASDTMQTKFLTLVNDVYNRNTTDGAGGTDALPSQDAATLFANIGGLYQPLVLFSTGAFETDSLYSGKTLTATFENSAPLVFGSGLEHLFMSVVSVGVLGGTADTDSVSGFAPDGKYALSQWSVQGGDPDATTDDKFYKSRVCGVAGTGASDVDPWCFAAAGMTDESGVAAAAGAVGAVKSAFDYMNNKQLFTLLALTADGAYLGSDANGAAYTEDGLTAYLKSMYQMPNEYTWRWESGDENYLDVFKEVFGYGLINLERATTPNKSVYYYDGNNIVSASGNAYWRAAQNTVFNASSAFSPRAASISAPFYDVLTSIDGEMSMPRVWKNEFTIGNSSRRALYMGDVLGELQTRPDVDNRVQVGNVGVSMAFSERAYADNLGGLDNLRLDFNHDNWNFAAGYQYHLTDGADRFAGMYNPILGLASGAVTSDVEYRMGDWAFGVCAVSGAVTNENLLANDPTISSQYMPATLGRAMGFGTGATFNTDSFNMNVSAGMMHESDTLLGAQTGGLLNLGAGDTIYVDSEMSYRASDNVRFMARATFARTSSAATGDFILGMSDIDSTAFGVGADIGNFSFAASLPLAVSRGDMQYAYADYDVIEDANGKYSLAINDAGVVNVDLTPANREVRLNATYRHRFGEFTDGALGFIYRVNPNHTREFGNESIFMMKMSHRVGI